MTRRWVLIFDFYADFPLSRNDDDHNILKHFYMTKWNKPFKTISEMYSILKYTRIYIYNIIAINCILLATK